MAYIDSEHTVSVRLTDALGAFVGQEFTLYVNSTNTPPQIVSTAVTRAAVNQDYSYQIVATDPENDNLTYSLGNSPAGMTVSENGLITWTPEENQLDDVNVSVFVTDAQGATSNQSFTIEIATQEVNGEVVPVAINNAPEIISNRGHRTQKGFLYVKKLDELLEALSGNAFSPMLFTTFIHGHAKIFFSIV